MSVRTGDEVKVIDPHGLEFDGVSKNQILTVTEVDDGYYFVHNPHGYEGYRYFFEDRHLMDGSIRKVSPNNTEHTNIEGFKSDVKITLKRWRTSNQVSGTHYSDLVVEPLDLAYLNDLDASQAKVLKYIMRHKTKGGADDVRKAIDVCQKILQYEYGEV